MPSRIFHFAFLVAFLALLPFAASAAGYEVTNVQVTVQASDAVKARDQAILQAQRKAFSILVGKSDKDLEKVTDAQLSRLVSDFSVKNTRLGVRSYAAVFTIRFEPNRTQNFIQSQGYDLVTQELSTMTGDSTITAQAPPVPVANQSIVVLPVLDVGSNRMLWDDANVWREVWQKKDNSIKGLPVRVPLGDVSDIADVPDAKFLTGGAANIPNLLTRYGAGSVYVVVAKNQGAALDPSGGMALSVYRHDGKTLKFLQKAVLHPRPGYLFDDAIPAALDMIALAENNKSNSEAQQTAAQQQPTSEEKIAHVNSEQVAILGTNATTSAPTPVIVTIPYQNLPQWVNIQRRLRTVQGVTNVVPIRVAPSSAEVQIISSEPRAQLSENFAAAGFELQAMPNGEVALIER